MRPDLQETDALVTFTEEILNGKLQFFVQYLPFHLNKKIQWWQMKCLWHYSIRKSIPKLPSMETNYNFINVVNFNCVSWWSANKVLGCIQTNPLLLRVFKRSNVE